MSKEPEIPQRKFDPKKLPRTFMSPAYLEEPEGGYFLMYRDITVETDEYSETGERLREKLGKRIGPIGRFRIAREGEQVDFTTSRPDGTVLLLTKVPNLGETL